MMNGYPLESRPVMMTRKEAEVFMKAIDQARISAVFQVEAIKRKKWLDSEKGMASIKYVEQLEGLKKLHEYIGTEFNLGGW